MFKYFICSIVLLTINSNLFSQKNEWDNNPQIVDYYDPSQKEKYHRYEYKILLCILSGGRRCNIDSAFKLFLTDSKFIAPTYGSTPVKDGGTLFVRLSLPGFDIPGLHPIRTKISIKNHVVINFTLPGHALHPGMVERKIVQVKDSLYLLTIGTGYSNATQFLSLSQGNCSLNGESILEPLSRLASIFDITINNIMKNMNEKSCIIADVWAPVHSSFVSAFKDYINKSASIIKPVKDSVANENYDHVIGGTTPEDLGRIILKAVKTNNKALYKACILPNQDAVAYSNVERSFDMLREDFPGKGLSDWSLMKFSRVTFVKDIGGGYSNDGGVVQDGPFKGEQVRRAFYIEFTYKEDFIGKIGSMTIITYKGKYFIANGGGRSSLSRM